MAIWELVRSAETRTLGLPEIQRQYRWDRNKAKTLADSLYRRFPIGGLTVWKPAVSVEVVSRQANDSGRTPEAWVIDGASRITTLCHLFGSHPQWGSQPDYKIQFNPRTEQFRHAALTHASVSADADPKRGLGRPPEWVDVHLVLPAKDGTIERIVANLGVRPEEQMTIMGRLMRLRSVADRELPVDSCDIDLEDLAEVFARLNAQGAKVSVAEIALAMAASRNPGFVANQIQPFLDSMAARSFAIDPALLLRSLAAIWRQTVTFKDIKADEWGDPYVPNRDLMAGWESVTKSWTALADYLGGYGLHRLEDIPSHNALLPLVVARAYWPALFDDDRALGWMLRAVRCGHYAASTNTVLTDDLAVILRVREGGGDLDALLVALEARLGFSDSHLFRAEEFRARVRPGGDLRFIMYVTFCARGARDWATGERLLLRGGQTVNPEWHHIFPREHLAQHNVDSELRNVWANMALIDRATNRSFSCDSPAAYLAKAGILGADGGEALAAQLVPTDPKLLTTSAYESFLSHRASQLAAALNERLSTR